MTTGLLPRAGHRALSLAPVAACFALAVWHMRYDWMYDPSYRYGWFVLPLALYLFSLRWRDRPEAGAPARGPWIKACWWLLAVMIPLTWLVREANPEWRLLSIVFTGIAAGASLLYLAETGGRKWVRHFSGPVLFIFASVPWPSIMERATTETLMPVNAAVTLEALHWMNIPAVRRGHLISLANGTLGVEEACSGIRSLQTTVMLALFLGELHHLRWTARLGLLLAGAGFALLTNIIRTIGLSAAAAGSGTAAAHSWHDTAGLLALAANVACLVLISTRSPRLSPASGKTTGLSQKIPAGRPVSGPVLCAAALLMMVPLTEWYYGRKESMPAPAWHLEKPVTAAAYRELPIDARTAIMLRYSSGWSAKWQTPPGKPVHGFYFEWDPGRVPPENMNVHRPGGCLANIGIEFTRELAPITASSGANSLTVRFLRFEDGDRPLHLIYLVDEKSRSGSADTGTFDFTYRNRLQAVLSGRRNPGQRVIEAGLWDEPSEEAARAVFTAFLAEWLRHE